MKANFFILTFVFLFVCVGFIQCTSHKKEGEKYPNVDSLSCASKPDPPITTESDAICFAVHTDGVISSLRKAQRQTKYEGWSVTTRRENSEWNVHVRSTGGIAPSYFCKVSFSREGSPIPKNYGRSVYCSYKK